MKRITRFSFREEELKALVDYLNQKISTRECAKIWGCSYEQVRILIGKIFIEGFQDGYVSVDFNKIKNDK